MIEAAAILGRHFDWELLPAISGQTAALVAETLGLAVEQLLVSADGTAFRFRHALTREAVLDTMLPPRQRALASAALAVLDAAHPRLEGGLRELAVELANRAGDRRRAGTLLSESGGQALAWGALATAIGTLRRAADLLEGTPEREQAELLLVEALALAGRVEEAAAAGGDLITRLGTEAPALRTEVHLRLSQAAVGASRWEMARHHLGIARRLAGPAPPVAYAPERASWTPRWPSPPMTSMRPGFSPRTSSPPRAVLRMSAVTRWSSSGGATGCVIERRPRGVRARAGHRGDRRPAVVAAARPARAGHHRPTRSCRRAAVVRGAARCRADGCAEYHSDSGSPASRGLHLPLGTGQV